MLTLCSPAKINLFLKIVDRRPDGYHNLASLFQTISLFDTLHFEINAHDQLSCSDPTIPTDHTNLVFKALNLFRNKTQIKSCFKIHLEKKIPHQAGLGGGSGNAATTLWALNQLCGKPASTSQLAEWSFEIGSDIPFFFSNGTAYCTGRGEHVRSLKAMPQENIWIIKPKEGLSTPAVYRGLNLSKLSKHVPDEHLESFLSGQKHYFNDLETAAFSVLPSLECLQKELLTCGFHTVLLAGSGSGLICFGNGHPPIRQGLFCREVAFLNRTNDQWYLLKDEG